MMLRRKYQLLGRIEGIFFARAEKKSFRFWWRYFQPDASLTEPKIAIVAGKKYFQTSVKRHRAKRKMAALLQDKVGSLPAGRYVYVLKPNFFDLDGSEGEMW